ncbi:7233_t:CDS:1 [Scutellospora calospora]|uniref:7233_t:CDS:1 n=1 Tax=Scutellospora calospora TaxID=85575 RepID=A0ACA9K4N2_9GLOM|nr:7233_t:CDS:1 [Scutellospora calospora]
MASEPALITLIHRLQNPIPQFVLGTLPILAIIGTTPHKKLLPKLLWFARCLGCPFCGLFYFCCIESNPIEMCSYWLEAKNFFIRTKGDNDSKAVEEGEKVRELIWPFGNNSCTIKPTKSQEKIMNYWISEASLLDRLSALSSLYYISVGIFAGISKALSLCMDDNSVEDWPFIPLLFIWTLPAINIRIKYGLVVNMVEPTDLKDEIEIEKHDLEKRKTSRNFTAIIAFISILLPWFAVIIAYFVPPVGFFCRSKFLTIICTIWSLNCIIAYISHVIGEKNVYGPDSLNILFTISGIVIATSLILLSILSNKISLWVTLFGSSCDVSCQLD